MSEQPATETQWLTPEDLAGMLQLSVNTIANWRSRKQGPAFKRIGGIVRYHPEVVAAWISDQPDQ